MEEGAHWGDEKNSGEEERNSWKVKRKRSVDLAVKIEDKVVIKVAEKARVALVDKEGEGEDVKASVECKGGEAEAEVTSFEEIALSETVIEISGEVRECAGGEEEKTGLGSATQTVCQPFLNTLARAKSYWYPQGQVTHEKSIDQNE